MTISRDNFSRRYSVVAETRRQWSDAEKWAIIAEAALPGANISAMARRHGIRPNLLFRWLRSAREEQACGSAAVFVPVTVSPPPASAEATVPRSALMNSSNASCCRSAEATQTDIVAGDMNRTLFLGARITTAGTAPSWKGASGNQRVLNSQTGWGGFNRWGQIRFLISHKTMDPGAGARTPKEEANLEKIVKLMRSASSATADVARGTPEGKALNFSVNASFLVAGINIPAGSAADSSRIVRLELNRPDEPERSRAELARWQAEIEGMGPALCNLAIEQASNILVSISVLKAAMAGMDARQADNFAPLIAGFFVGINRRAITPEEAKELVAEHREAIDEHADAQEEDDAVECLNFLFGSRCRFNDDGTYVEKSIGQLLAKVFSGTNDDRPREVLGQHGVTAIGDRFAVATNHPQLKYIFRGTPWSNNMWTTALRRLPGAIRHLPGRPKAEVVTFPDKTRSRFTLLPQTIVTTEDE